MRWARHLNWQVQLLDYDIPQDNIKKAFTLVASPLDNRCSGIAITVTILVYHLWNKQKNKTNNTR